MAEYYHKTEGPVIINWFRTKSQGGVCHDTPDTPCATRRVCVYGRNTQIPAIAAATIIAWKTTESLTLRASKAHVFFMPVNTAWHDTACCKNATSGFILIYFFFLSDGIKSRLMPTTRKPRRTQNRIVLLLCRCYYHQPPSYRRVPDHSIIVRQLQRRQGT